MKRFLYMLLIIPFLLSTDFVVSAEESGVQEEIIYNIIVDRFNVGDHAFNEEVRVNDPLAYQGGDLQGIMKKLDALQELGFTAISLSPIMANDKDGYHGYWIEDFFEVEEQFGTMEDLNKLVEEAHKRDIKVILEFVTNYVALSHPFVDDSDKMDWFRETTTKATSSTEWLNNVVTLNQENEDVEAYLIDVADFWMEETAIDGFKIHDADLTSESFLENFTSHISAVNPDFYLLASLSGQDGSASSVRNNPYIDAVDNYSMYEKLNEVFTEPDIPVSILFDAWEKDKNDSDLLFVDNKNTARFSNLFSDNGRNALTTWKLALTYMLTSPGVPSIYQGSELPMYGPGFPENQQMVQFNSTDPDIEEFYHRLTSIRSQFPVLVYGDFEQVGSSEAMSLFKRSYQGESMYIAINNSSEAQTIHIPNTKPGMQLKGLLADDIVRENNEGNYSINISRETIEIYRVEADEGLNWLFIGAVVLILSLFVIVVIFLSRQQKKRG